MTSLLIPGTPLCVETRAEVSSAHWEGEEGEEDKREKVEERERWGGTGRLAEWREVSGVHSLGVASVSSASFSWLYPHLNGISEKNSASWLRVGRRKREQ